MLPERVDTSTRPPPVPSCHLIVPHMATVCASRTSEVYVPRSARVADNRSSRPGFDVATITRSSRSGRRLVTCCALTRATSVGQRIAGEPIDLCFVTRRHGERAAGFEGNVLVPANLARLPDQIPTRRPENTEQCARRRSRS